MPDGLLPAESVVDAAPTSSDVVDMAAPSDVCVPEHAHTVASTADGSHETATSNRATNFACQRWKSLMVRTNSRALTLHPRSVCAQSIHLS